MILVDACTGKGKSDLLLFVDKSHVIMLLDIGDGKTFIDERIHCAYYVLDCEILVTL